MKFLLTIALVLSQTLNAQIHHEFWSKLNFKSKISDHWSWGMDYQYRRQSDYPHNKTNPFHAKLAGSARLWAYYKIDESWELVASPFAYFRNYDFINQSEGIKPTDEWRYSAGLIHTHKINELELRGRLLGEHRNFISSKQNSVDRLRIQLTLSHKLKDINTLKIEGLIMEEYHYRMNIDQLGTDQNRLYAGIRGKNKKLELSLGYQWTRQYIAANYTDRLQTHISLNITI